MATLAFVLAVVFLGGLVKGVAGSVLALSVLAAVPGVAGVVAGSRLRGRVPPAL